MNFMFEWYGSPSDNFDLISQVKRKEKSILTYFLTSKILMEIYKDSIHKKFQWLLFGNHSKLLATQRSSSWNIAVSNSNLIFFLVLRSSNNIMHFYLALDNPTLLLYVNNASIVRLRESFIEFFSWEWSTTNCPFQRFFYRKTEEFFINM